MRLPQWVQMLLYLSHLPSRCLCSHDDVIKWKHFPRYWPFVREIHRSTVNSPHKGQWRGALMFSLICVWINGWVNDREAGDLRRYRVHYDVTVMVSCDTVPCYIGTRLHLQWIALSSNVGLGIPIPINIMAVLLYLKFYPVLIIP